MVRKMTRAAILLLLIPLAACQRMTALVRPNPIECSVAAVTACDAPIIPKGRTLGESEPIDAANDVTWLVCVERHKAAVKCLQAADAAGVIRFRAAAQSQEQTK